ncbi:response regulator transcription factor [Saccharothrix sp.]|uniref:response regulator transcription factor n=1 Tax=Saccharothrix sp. TaxID=1873460 RepID=UPI002810C412|nr:response regulator transcription factor [Saccharothrix sp.]
MIRVVLADDEPMVRAGVKTILGTDPGIEVVAEGGDGREAVELTVAHRPDVVLLDIRMPRVDGLAAVEELGRVAPGVAVVMLTTFDEDEYVARALGSGASGFLLKAADPRELIIGVRAAADGAAYLSPRIAQRLVQDLRGGRLSRHDEARRQVAMLSGREREVLGLVGRGMSNQEIAGRLFVAEGTVKAHMTAILQRLGVSNRVQAAILAHDAGLTG